MGPAVIRLRNSGIFKGFHRIARPEVPHGPIDRMSCRDCRSCRGQQLQCLQAGRQPRSGAGGQQTGGVGGTGGTAGSGGLGGGGAGGRGGMAGTKPLIIIDASATDGHVNPDANCGARSKTAMKVAPDILILLDRSGSMNDDINNQMCRPDGGVGAAMGCGAKSKWAQVTPAIMQVVSETQADVNWGLKWFPDNHGQHVQRQHDRGCPGRARKRRRDRHRNHGGDRPDRRRGGLQRHAHARRRAGATTYMSTLTDMSPKFILLATDGLPTCAGDSGAAADDSAAA